MKVFGRGDVELPVCTDVGLAYAKRLVRELEESRWRHPALVKADVLAAGRGKLRGFIES